MRILLDHNVPRPLAALLTGHAGVTSALMSPRFCRRLRISSLAHSLSFRNKGRAESVRLLRSPRSRNWRAATTRMTTATGRATTGRHLASSPSPRTQAASASHGATKSVIRVTVGVALVEQSRRARVQRSRPRPRWPRRPAATGLSKRTRHFMSGCDLKVVPVIVRRGHATGPAVPSAVP